LSESILDRKVSDSYRIVNNLPTNDSGMSLYNYTHASVSRPLRESQQFENNSLNPAVYNIFSGNESATGSGILQQLDFADNMSQALGMQTDDKMVSYDSRYFNRYRTIYPGDELAYGKKYCFIVKPDLNIFDAVAKDPYFSNLLVTKPHILQSLTHVDLYGMSQDGNGGVNEDNHFISFLSPRVMDFSLPDFQVEEYRLDQPFTGFTTSYAGNSNSVRTNQSTQVQFRENESMDITALFDAWIKYIDLVSYGIISPYHDYAAARFYYGTSIIDYATSIYEIITKPDGTDILYWAKITGAFPTTIPHSNYRFTWEDRMDNGIEIQFSGGLPEVLTPQIFADFNYNAGILGSNGTNESETGNILQPNPRYVPHSQVFADVDGTPSGASMVGAPFITFDFLRKVYKLRWRPRPYNSRLNNENQQER
jgi:hypothetical protein